MNLFGTRNRGAPGILEFLRRPRARPDARVKPHTGVKYTTGGGAWSWQKRIVRIRSRDTAHDLGNKHFNTYVHTVSLASTTNLNWNSPSFPLKKRSFACPKFASDLRDSDFTGVYGGNV